MKANVLITYAENDLDNDYPEYQILNIEIDGKTYDQEELLNSFAETYLGKLSPSVCVAAIYKHLQNLEARIAMLEDDYTERTSGW